MYVFMILTSFCVVDTGRFRRTGLYAESHGIVANVRPMVPSSGCGYNHVLELLGPYQREGIQFQVCGLVGSVVVVG